jgi:hypothetical protein
MILNEFGQVFSPLVQVTTGSTSEFPELEPSHVLQKPEDYPLPLSSSLCSTGAKILPSLPLSSSSIFKLNLSTNLLKVKIKLAYYNLLPFSVSLGTIIYEALSTEQ